MQAPLQYHGLGRVCDNGLKTPLIIIPEGVKVNPEVSVDQLKEEVLPWEKEQHWEHGYRVMKDGTPSDTYRVIQAKCKANFKASWDKDTGPPSSPDLNPMNFAVSAMLEVKVEGNNYPNVEASITALRAAGDEIPAVVMQRICSETPCLSLGRSPKQRLLCDRSLLWLLTHHMH